MTLPEIKIALAPMHPGEFVREEVLAEFGLTVTGAAAALGVTRPALSALLNERAALSPEMAIRLEKAFGVSMEALMRMQNAYDIAEAKKRRRAVNVARFRRKPVERRAAAR